jgi:hypothetical protein
VKQEWFEMKDIGRRNFSNSVWIPLRAVHHVDQQGNRGYEGYKEDFFGAGSIAVPMKHAEIAKRLNWVDIGISHHHSGCAEEDGYTPADVYKDYQDELEGIHLVLDQPSYGTDPSVWHLHQDLVLTLDLRREGNIWVCPRDGYAEVARLKVTEENEPVLLEVKAEYLKDYLCARKMGLYVTSYYKRQLITADTSSIDWEDENVSHKGSTETWEGRIAAIHEGGHPFGEKIAVFHLSRTDVDETDDIPDISGIPINDNTTGDSWEREFTGRKLYRVWGELWRNELILPGKYSPKVRDDEVPSTVYFTIDADGSKVCGRDLNCGKWLWFKPDVVMALCHRRGGNLSFFTAQTGSVTCSPGEGVHFGINELGFVNVYAKDIGWLPEWQQQIWAAYNITPEGGVSSELLASQVRADPADTQAPESYLQNGIETINELSLEKLGIRLFRNHESIPDLLTKVHRFRAIDEASLYALAKDLARLIADSLDADAMQTIVAPPKKEKWGSLKSLENLLASKFGREGVRETTAALVGIYELRHADAHLPSSKVEEAFQLINIDRSLPLVHQGHKMLFQVVSSLFGVAEALKYWR